MEEGEQAGPEPEPEQKAEAEEEAEPEPLRRCGRHPSQLLTGICSSCLMERLSSVRDEPEIVELGAAEASGAGAAGEGADAGKLRKTLMLLFQLDDSCSGSGVAHPSEEEDSQAAEIGGGDRGGRRKSGSWLRSILPRRGMRWRRSGGSSVKAPSPPPPPPQREEAVDPSGCGPSSSSVGGRDLLHSHGRGADAQVERRLSFRRSCDWRVGREPASKSASVEPPRHSWDGSMVGRAFACSFACLEDSPARRVRRSNAEETAGEARGGVAESTNGGRHSVDSGSEGRHIRGRNGGDAGLDMAVPGVGRRRSNRWSRVWDRSITSPLKEFVRKGEHALERSLSESRREVRRGKNAEAPDISGEIHPGRSNGHVSSRASQSTRSLQAVSNGDVQNFRADWLKNKECKIGRSRSVHYTSPGNLDNGMLRFYLTPMRSTRVTNRGRRRNSRLFGRGLFGFI